MTVRIDAKIVRAALAPEAVLDALGIEYQRRGKELRTKLCPKCGPRSRDSVCIAIDGGVWCCKVCGASEGVLDLLAAYAGLEVGRDFPKVLELGARIAGVLDATADEGARIVVERRAAGEQRRRRDAERVAAARAQMAELWVSLAERHAGGEAYLRDERGLDPSALREIGDVVRYSEHGEPALALRDLENGDVVGIQYRRILPGEPKLRAEWASQLAGAALHGRVAEIDEGRDVAVIVEGFADTLAAVLAFPGCALYGAAGADQLEAVAGAVAPRVAKLGGWLLLVPHDDGAGEDGQGGAGTRGGVRAIDAAIAAGLNLAPDDAGLDGAGTVRLVDLGDHKDLAAARRGGWLWQWPDRRAA